MSVSDILPEPDSGTKLVLLNDFALYTVIWRDDVAADHKNPELRWFVSNTPDHAPRSWEEITRRVRAVFAVADPPHAVARVED